MAKRINEFHQEVKRKRILVIFRLFLLCTVLILVAAISCYLLFISSFFKIHTISYDGLHYTSSKSFAQYIAQYKNQNILFASFNQTLLKNKFPLVRAVSFDKEYPSHLVVHIVEYPPLFLIQTNQRTYAISENGIIFDQVSNNSQKYALPLVVSNENDIHKIPITDIASFVKQIESDKTEFVTNMIFSSPFDIMAYYSDNHTVLFSLHKDMLTQIQEMLRIKNLMGFGTCKHLDVRFDNIYCAN